MFSALSLMALLAAPKVSGWLVFYDGGASLAAFAAHGDALDSVGAEWYQCGTSGEVNYVSYATADKREAALRIARRHHVAIFGMIQNPGFDPTPVEVVLTDPDKRAAHAKALSDACVRDRLDGIDLDYESLKAADRDNFSAFVDTLADDLHSQHKLLAIALHSKESEPGNWDGPQAQDWARLGRAADHLRVMCYDEHWSTSGAGPIADIAWVARVMSFAVTLISPAKLEIGIPGYGYDWVGKKGSDLDWNRFAALPGADKATRDPASQELVLPHGNATAWFCDSVSEIPKLNLAQTLGVRGVCVWHIGSLDPKFWDAVALFRGSHS